MSFDESLFSFFYKLKKRKQAEIIEKKKIDSHAVELESCKEQLSFYASAIFQTPIEIRSTNGIAYQSSNKLFLPSYVASEVTSEKNNLFYKLLVLHLFGSWIHFKDKKESYKIDNDYQSHTTVLLERSAIQNILTKLFPNYENLFIELTNHWTPEELIPYSELEFKTFKTDEFGFSRRSLFGGFPKETAIMAGGDTAGEMRQALPDANTELKNKRSHQVKKLNLDENKENMGQVVFSHFEKLETLEEFSGVQRELDGADELEVHADALDELNLEDVIRTSKAVQSLYKTEIDMGFEIADFGSESVNNTVKVYHYDEWDYQKRTYKKDWCTINEEIYQKKPVVVDPEVKAIKRKTFAEMLEERKAEVEHIRKKLLRVSSQYVKKKKLYDGRFVDIDNYIRNFTLVRRNMTSDGRNYLDVFKKNRDLSILILVDNSLSADSWVQNRRVLDLSLESLLTFGEAIYHFSDPIMVAGFSSNTRNSCKFSIWKDFDLDWHKFKDIADEIVPEGYTRMGPAIRHGLEILLKRKEKKRVLLILTDGRPTDYDRYEGVYGLSDVRKAIEECEREGIVPFAIAVDPSAKQFLPKLFGAGNYSILLDIKKLPDILTSLYIKISKK